MNLRNLSNMRIFSQFLLYLIGFLLLPIFVSAKSLLSQGIIKETIQLRGKQIEYVGYPHAAFNGTEVGILFHCLDQSDYEYEAQFVLRSSPCDKEFFNANRKSTLRDLLDFYFTQDRLIPSDYDYDKILFYRSQVHHFNCKDQTAIFPQDIPAKSMVIVDVTPFGVNRTKGTIATRNHAVMRAKRQPGLNGDSIDGGHSDSLSSWNPVQTLPLDGIYFLVVKLTVKTAFDKHARNLTVQVEWRGPNGYLSAIDRPLLTFYGIMCTIYAVFALVWFIICVKYWKDLLRIQFWIGAVILLDMVEKTVFYAEYQTMNLTGISVQGAIELAEMVSCLKRTLARMLIIIVSCGFGVVKPRLGSTLHQVVGVGFVYFIFCSIEGVIRVSKNQPEDVKQKQLATLPLILLEVGIFWWIFTSLLNTMRALRMRRNEVKLSIYRHLTNTLCFAVLTSLVFIIWSSYQHIFTDCLRDWTELWVDTAFWHVLFCIILLVIMILWRPSNTNQRYAFTPLLDYSEDENDDDEIFNSDAFVTEALKLKPSERRTENRHQSDPDAALREELKWVEENIPSSLVDKLAADSDEEAEQTKFELSKMQ